MKVYCCGCGTDVDARMTNGAEIYPHRTDLHHLPFCRCDACGNYVGCHNESRKPLGVIPTADIRSARQRVHRILDPIWQGGGARRKEIYGRISADLGYRYHTAEIRSVEEADRVYALIKSYLEEADK